MNRKSNFFSAKTPTFSRYLSPHNAVSTRIHWDNWEVAPSQRCVAWIDTFLPKRDWWLEKKRFAEWSTVAAKCTHFKELWRWPNKSMAASGGSPQPGRALDSSSSSRYPSIKGTITGVFKEIKQQTFCRLNRGSKLRKPRGHTLANGGKILVAKRDKVITNSWKKRFCFQL